jgi:hypothetical protein
VDSNASFAREVERNVSPDKGLARNAHMGLFEGARGRLVPVRKLSNRPLIELNMG